MAGRSLSVPPTVPGFQKVNTKKSVSEPAQMLDFLGFTVDTVQMGLKLLVNKIKKICVESQAMLRVDQISGRALARLVG